MAKKTFFFPEIISEKFENCGNYANLTLPIQNMYTIEGMVIYYPTGRVTVKITSANAASANP